MSAKDGILHAMKWTVTDEFNHKMEVSNAVDGCVIFYPHNGMVQLSFEDLDKLISNLKKSNSDYIRKTVKGTIDDRQADAQRNQKDFSKYLDEVRKRDVDLFYSKSLFEHYNYWCDEYEEELDWCDEYKEEELKKRLVKAPVEETADDNWRAKDLKIRKFIDKYNGRGVYGADGSVEEIYIPDAEIQSIEEFYEEALNIPGVDVDSVSTIGEEKIWKIEVA